MKPMRRAVCWMAVVWMVGHSVSVEAQEPILESQSALSDSELCGEEEHDGGQSRERDGGQHKEERDEEDGRLDVGCSAEGGDKGQDEGGEGKGDEGEGSEEPSVGRRTLNVVASVVPGVVVHGAGHMAAGDWETGTLLLAAEGAGLAMAVGGIAGLAVTGASSDLIVPFAWLLIEGAGLLLVPALADLYGVATPAGGTGLPQVEAPWLRAELGYRYIYSPIFAYRNFTVAAAQWRWRGLRIEPEAWVATDDDNNRLRVMAAWRFVGPRPGQRATDGSFVEIEGGYTRHRYGTERFSENTGEFSGAGRLDLGRVATSLQGSFVETSLGLAMGAYTYDGIATESTELLLARFAFGFYTGHSRDGWGETSVYYDHRHDGYAAGLKIPGLGSGNAGHFGLQSTSALWEGLGLRFHAESGSSHVVGVSMLYQLGGER
ncbi:MAG: hypothetical protein AAFX99_03570 [Myxococcota bacterium]